MFSPIKRPRISHGYLDTPKLFDGSNLFDEIFGTSFQSLQQWTPNVDVRELEAHYAIQVEVPGISPEHVEISTLGDTLTIKGEKITEVRKDDEKGRQHLVERRSGSFQRQFTFPGKIDPENVSAKAENGVLTVTVTKPEDDKPRRIDILGL